MKLFKILLLSGLLTIVSCSKSSKKDSEVAGGDPLMESEADFIVDADDEELIIEEEPLISDEGAVEPIVLDEAVASSPTMEVTNDIGTYTVKKGETLMMVAFNVYGDYRKWKEISDFNGLNGQQVAAGATIKYKKPATEFIWNPEGLPYLIKRGDSLVSISNDKYGTANKWRLIYNNNRPLIKDPSLIFAGFTLYYIPERDIASE